MVCALQANAQTEQDDKGILSGNDAALQTMVTRISLNPPNSLHIKKNCFSFQSYEEFPKFISLLQKKCKIPRALVFSIHSLTLITKLGKPTGILKWSNSTTLKFGL
jgi:hypothetical protein